MKFAALMLLSPILVVMTLFFLVPSLMLLQIGFYENWPTVGKLTFDNYVTFFLTPYYIDLLFQSFKLASIVTVATLLVGYPLAFEMTRVSSKFKSAILILTISPLLVSVVVRAFGWMIILGYSGLLNNLLLSLHLISSPLPLLFTFDAVVVGFVHVLLPFMVLPIASVLRNIERNLYDASRSLGAGRLHTFYRVTLPLSLPGVAAGSMLVFFLTMGSFATPTLLGGGKVNDLAVAIYSQTFLMIPNYSFSAATSYILLASTLLLVIVYLRFVELKMWAASKK
jgi:putative spermidine/putrescine transport system permease protein